jgi:hypothetical protein
MKILFVISIIIAAYFFVKGMIELVRDGIDEYKEFVEIETERDRMNQEEELIYIEEVEKERKMNRAV